jgi:hypothetical protein
LSGSCGCGKSAWSRRISRGRRRASNHSSVWRSAIAIPNVAKYGLENVLFPSARAFLEIVSPTRAGTTAGRFLERHGGKYGYMVILDCDDPERYRRRAESLGVRVANVIRHDAYFGVQLHPKDTGAAMLEFNSTVGGGRSLGPYWPAGPALAALIRSDRTRSMLGVELESPEPERLAERWASIFERPVRNSAMAGAGLRSTQGQSKPCRLV